MNRNISLNVLLGAKLGWTNFAMFLTDLLGKVFMERKSVK